MATDTGPRIQCSASDGEGPCLRKALLWVTSMIVPSSPVLPEGTLPMSLVPFHGTSFPLIFMH